MKVIPPENEMSAIINESNMEKVTACFPKKLPAERTDKKTEKLRIQPLRHYRSYGYTEFSAKKGEKKNFLGFFFE